MLFFRCLLINYKRMSIPAELINVIFSFVGSETAPLIKSFVKKVGEKYSEGYNGNEDGFILDRDFFAGAFVVGHQENLLKNGKVFLWSSINDYDEFEPEIFGDENRTGEKEIYSDYLKIVECYYSLGNYYLGF